MADYRDVDFSLSAVDERSMYVPGGRFSIHFHSMLLGRSVLDGDGRARKA